jgi:integrase
MSVQGSVYAWCICRDQVTGRRLGSRCPRRGRQGHGSWYLSLEMPAGADGARRRVRRGGYLTRNAAREALSRLVLPVTGADRAAPVTVGQWLQRWLGQAGRARESTRRGYASHIRLYLVPHLGRVLLAELTSRQVQAMFTAVARQHAAAGRPVTAATLTRVKATLRAALNAAVRAGYLAANPAAHVQLPPARRPRAAVWTSERIAAWQDSGIRPPVAVWTAAQTAAFLNAVRGHRLYAAFHLIALRGLRRAEACGLRWQDVDLDGGTVVICGQLQQYDGHLTVAPHKTPRSERVIALDRTTVAALRRHRGLQQAERERASGAYHASGYVFTGLNGDPLAPERLSRIFKKLTAEAGLPPIRLHDLRHGAASLAQMSRIASDASFCSLSENARPAAQRTALGELRASMSPVHDA